MVIGLVSHKLFTHAAKSRESNECQAGRIFLLLQNPRMISYDVRTKFNPAALIRGAAFYIRDKKELGR